MFLGFKKNKYNSGYDLIDTKFSIPASGSAQGSSLILVENYERRGMNPARALAYYALKMISMNGASHLGLNGFIDHICDRQPRVLKYKKCIQHIINNKNYSENIIANMHLG